MEPKTEVEARLQTQEFNHKISSLRSTGPVVICCNSSRNRESLPLTGKSLVFAIPRVEFQTKVGRSRKVDPCTSLKPKLEEGMTGLCFIKHKDVFT